MPIEIRQLIIRATVTDNGDGTKESSPRGAETDQPRNKVPSRELVAECVEQVMEILREQQER